MARRALVSALLALILAGAAPVAAATGTAVGVDPEAQAEAGGESRILVVGADVQVGERIVTGARGQVQIVFDDQTRLVVGPRSALVIEDYLVRSTGSASKVAIDALSGSFRFITGNSAKPAYSITTPTGSIGVRGTAFDFAVARGTTAVLLYHGAVELCSRGGRCVTLARRCEMGAATGAEAFLVNPGTQNRETLTAQFRYLRSQAPLLAAFRVAETRTCQQSDSAPAQSLTTGSGDPAPTRPSTGPSSGGTSR